MYIDSALSTIRNELEKTLRGTNFYSYRFYTNEDDWEKITKFGKIDVCVIYPLQIRLQEVKHGSRLKQRKSTIRIEYYYSYSGEKTSEKIFINNTELIIEKLNEISLGNEYIIEGDITANTSIVSLKGVISHQCLIDINLKGEDIILSGCKEAI